MMRRLHLVLFVVLIALGSAPVCGAAPGSVSGVVRDSAGVPQIGAVVQLLRPDLSVIASVYTDANGRFTIRFRASGPLCGQGDGHLVSALAARKCAGAHAAPLSI